MKTLLHKKAEAVAPEPFWGGNGGTFKLYEIHLTGRGSANSDKGVVLATGKAVSAPRAPESSLPLLVSEPPRANQWKRAMWAVLAAVALALLASSLWP